VRIKFRDVILFREPTPAAMATDGYSAAEIIAKIAKMMRYLYSAQMARNENCIFQWGNKNLRADFHLYPSAQIFIYIPVRGVYSWVRALFFAPPQPQAQ
jgi:hypothetical protein